MTKEQLFNHLIQRLSSSNAFFGHAVIDEQDEAMMVMMNLFDQDVPTILSSGFQPVNQSLIDQGNEIIDQRISTLKPMAYLIGKVNFAELIFNIDERALVPRSPIAELILNGFEQWLQISDKNRVLDLCTGSGCIGIAMAHYYSHLTVDLSDISQPALDLALKNRKAHQLDHRVNLICSDLFDGIAGVYDVIVTNPPYVSDCEYKSLPKEYTYEPKKGLVTDMDGLRIPIEILLKAPNYLNENGWLFLEVGYSHELLENAFESIEFEWVDFLNGGEGVCVFNRKKLLEYHHLFKAYLETNYVV